MSFTMRLQAARRKKDLTAEDVIPFAHEFRDMDNNSVGGHLHIVLDDGNCEDHFVEFCKLQADRDHDIKAYLLADTLLSMPETEREKVAEAFYSREEQV